MIRVLVVIVNDRTGDLVIDCLRSLAPEIALLAGARVVITDNASGDGSAARIQSAIQASAWGSWAAVMPLDRNGGFSYGNNAVIRPALVAPDPPDLVLLLNPDTLVRPGAVVALVEFMASYPRAGIAGSRIEDPDGAPHGAATVLTNTRIRRGAYWYDSCRRFFVKAYGVAGLIAADLLWAIGRLLLLRRLIGLAGNTPLGDPRRLALDLLCGDLRSALTGRVWSIDRHARPA